MEHKGKLFDMAIIPSFVYGPTKKAPKPGYKRTKKLTVAYRKMERKMENVTLLDRKNNHCLKGVTKMQTVLVTAPRRKWN